jgi:hypothetical protein
MVATPEPRKPYASVEEAQADVVRHKELEMAAHAKNKDADPKAVALSQKHLDDAKAALALTQAKNADAAKAKAKA